MDARVGEEKALEPPIDRLPNGERRRGGIGKGSEEINHPLYEKKA